MKVKSESEVAQSCPTLSDPMDCSLPGSSIHGIFQARVLEWGATAIDSDGKESGFDSWGQKIPSPPWERGPVCLLPLPQVRDDYGVAVA